MGTKTDRARKAALDRSLRGMFGKLQSRAVPEQLIALADDLEAAAERPPMPVKKAASAG